MGFLAGDYTPHPNSLMFNGIPIFWPFKAYWFTRKVSAPAHPVLTRACSSARSCSFGTSPLPQRATLITRGPAGTSTSPSTTERG